ncbi:MAG: hypothetical protein QXD11_01940 [Candidatus Micrarchaeaceae archaeon]
MKLVIRSLNKPPSGDIDLIIGWFCEVFGLSNSINDRLEIQLLKKFMLAAKNGQGLASKDIKFGMPRSTIIYHLNRFIESGILVKKGRKYYLRAAEMTDLVEEVEYDVRREFQRIYDIAGMLDIQIYKKSKKQM